MPRKRSNLFVPRIITTLPLLTTANATTVKENLADTLISDNFLISTKLKWTIRDLTVGQGPILVGIALADYTAAEITETILAQGAWDQSDRVTQEQARRKVRVIGSFSGNAAEEVLNDGMPIKTVCKWKMFEGETLSIFAYNATGATFTTGAEVIAEGVAFFKNI